MDQTLLFDILYSLAACGGREAALFGGCAPAARQAFARSRPTAAFPELWFELPLLGEPWFDLHALTSRDSLDPGMEYSPQTTGGHPEVFRWFAQAEGARQLALSWDVSSGAAEGPAVQLLQWRDDADLACGFLEAAGRADAVPDYRAFTSRMPTEWFACYAGVFPQRPGHNLRLECIPGGDLQHAYAQDAGLVADHLRWVGVGASVDAIAEQCSWLAGMPFQFELQFDVEPGGAAGATVGASVRFAQAAGKSATEPFDPNGTAGELMRQLEGCGLADGRWKLLADTAFAKRATLGAESCLLYCVPTFVKLRWRNGNPLDAKAYLIAGAVRD